MGWATSSQSYNGTNSPIGGYNGSYTTYLQNSVGSITGEWLQIQSSVPVTMSNFYLTTAALTANYNLSRFPKTFYICGSNDNSTWYPILYGNWTSLPVANTTGPLLPTNTYSIPTGTTTGGTLTGSTTTGPGTAVGLTYNTYGNGANAYTYFRLIITNIVSTNFGATLGDGATAYCTFIWSPTFTVAQKSGPSRTLLYMDPSNINQLDVSGSLALVNSNASTMVVTPNTTAATSYNWVNNNITWALTNTPGNPASNPYTAFSNQTTDTIGGLGWQDTNYSTTSPYYTGSASTTVLTPTSKSVSGGWLQIQSSMPLILNNYALTSAGYATTLLGRLPGNYTIAGSNDGSTWYDIQDVSFTGLPPGTSGSVVTPQTTNYMNVSAIGTVTASTTAITNAITSTYGYQTKPFIYFRFITKNTLTSGVAAGGGNGYMIQYAIQMNFTPVSSTISMSLDPGIPNQLNIGGSLAIAGGVTPMYSTPSLTPNQIGYTYYTTVAYGATAVTTNSSIFISNVLPGVYMAAAGIAFNGASTNANITLAITYNNTSTPITYFTNYGTGQGNSQSATMSVPITITAVTTAAVNITLVAGSANFASGSNNYLQLVRIA